MEKLVTKVPAKLTWDGQGGTKPGWGNAGWRVFHFHSAQDAADFVSCHPEAAMPCWKRFEIRGQVLVQVC